MFYNAKPIIFERAKVLRKRMTNAEQKIWEVLKEKQILGLKFRAQHPMYLFIADFYCHQLKLVIEIDGDIHKHPDQKEYDINREAELKCWGVKVVRFTNQQIESDLDKVVTEIKAICCNRIAELKVPFRGFRGRAEEIKK